MSHHAHVQQPPIIAAFREWTRGTSFTLAMGKTQVATLVAVAESRARKIRDGHIGAHHRALKYWSTACGGLRERGLLVHIYPHPDDAADIKKYGHAKTRRGTHEFFPLTAAGDMVVELLKLCGVYQELVAEFDEIDRRDPLPRSLAMERESRSA